MKKMFLSLLVSCVGIIFSLFVVEIAVRMLSRKTAPPKDDRPFTYYLHEDAETQQDNVYLKEKPASTIRVAAVGDSFTFAPYMQADDTFPKKLERIWNLNHTQPKVEVINYGVPRYSASHEVAVVERAIEEKADLIILQVTLNDPEIKPYRPTGLIEANGGGEEEKYTGFSRIRRDKFGGVIVEGLLFDYWKTANLVSSRILATQTTEAYKRYFFDLFESKRSWEGFANAHRKIRKLASEANIPVASVVFPLFGFPNDAQYPFHPLHSKLRTFFQELQEPSLDLFTTFEEIPLDRLVVLPGRDRHPNEIAHRLAAEAIDSWVKEQKLLPESVFAKVRGSERLDVRL